MKPENQASSRFDAVLKEIFVDGRPSLLLHLTGGRAIVEALNVEMVFRLAE